MLMPYELKRRNSKKQKGLETIPNPLNVQGIV